MDHCYNYYLFCIVVFTFRAAQCLVDSRHAQPEMCDCEEMWVKCEYLIVSLSSECCHITIQQRGFWTEKSGPNSLTPSSVVDIAQWWVKIDLFPLFCSLCLLFASVHPSKKNRQTCVRKSLICAFAMAFIISVMLIAANQMLRNGME